MHIVDKKRAILDYKIRRKTMGKLIVDGNSVYEIDEECLKNRPVPEECKVYDALRKMEKKNQNHERSSPD